MKRIFTDLNCFLMKTCGNPQKSVSIVLPSCYGWYRFTLISVGFQFVALTVEDTRHFEFIAHDFQVEL